MSNEETQFIYSVPLEPLSGNTRITWYHLYGDSRLNVKMRIWLRDTVGYENYRIRVNTDLYSSTISFKTNEDELEFKLTFDV